MRGQAPVTAGANDAPEAAAQPESVVKGEAGRKVYPTIPHATPETIVIWCADARIQEGVHKFLLEEKGLDPGDYLPFVFPGGIAPSFDPLGNPKEAWFFVRTIRFYLTHFSSIKKIIAINHEDCARYRALIDLMGRSRIRSVLEHQHVDLKKLSAWLTTQVPNLPKIEGYYAKFANPEHTLLEFEQIV